MTTIITKNGSGAPTAGQLSEGELAVDLTNKELYTKSGSTVIKIGAQGGSTGTFTDLTATSSFTSPGIDDNATSTAITINAAEDVGIGTVSPDTRLHVSGANPRLRITDNNSTAATASTYLEFYGTDARSGVVYSDANGLNIQTDAAGPNSIRFLTAGNGEVMRVDSSGDVGLGTTTPDTILHLKDSTPILTMEHAAGQSARLYFEDATDGAWGGIRATYGASGATKEISLAPGNNTGDARFGGLTLTAAKATIGGDFQDTSLDVLGSVKAIGASRSVAVEDTGANGTKAFLNTASTSAKVEVSRAGAGASRATLTARGNSSDLEFENYQGHVATINHGSTSEFSFTMDAVAAARMTFNTGTAEAMRITQVGNVGIGTVAPQTKLHVTQSVEDGSDGIRLSRSNSAATYTQWVDPAARYNIGYSNPATSDPAEALLSLDGQSGRVGIGTTAPTQPLTIEDNAAGLTSAISLTHTDSGNNPRGGTLVYNVNNGNTQKDAAFIQGGKFSNASGGFVSISTADSSWNAPVEHMRIDNSGNVLIGKDNGSTSVDGVQLDITTGAGRIINSKTTSGIKDSLMNYYSGTYVGGVRYTDTTTAFPTSSDERLKDNIVDAPAGNIDDLKVRSFDWKSNGEHQEYGFVAQELEPVAPYAVSSCGTEDAMLAVDYSKLVPMLVKEIQDLKAEVAALKGA
jgi:hypothetical protein